MSKVQINPNILRWARERSGVSVDTLLKKFPKYEDWEQGDDSPSLKQLEELAKKTMTHYGCFFLENPPEEKLPIPDFRTAKDNPIARPSPNLLETIETMQLRQAWMHDFLIDQGHKKLDFLGSENTKSAPGVVAKKIRSVLKIGPDWANKHSTWEDALRALRNAIEEAGILVMFNGVVGDNTHRKLDQREFRGFVLYDEIAPLIFVNNSDAKAAQLFTLAHELAHIWIGEEGVFNLEKLQPSNHKTEIFCNQVAAEFLIPTDELVKAWSNAKDVPEPFQIIARKFKVSSIVAARRALDLKLIDKTAFFDFYETDSKRIKTKSSGGGDFYLSKGVKLGRRFAHAIIGAARQGRIQYGDAYRLTGLRGSTFDKYAIQLGFNSKNDQ